VVMLAAYGGVFGGEAVTRWLVAVEAEVAMTEEMAKKLGEKASFSPSLASDFLMLNVWNPPLFIRGGREIFCLY